MKKYLAFGAGINSTALMLLLINEGIEFESVFVNHGTDLPETYEYIEYLKNKGYHITIIKPNFQGFSNLYEYCKNKKFFPSYNLRWCSYRFKLQPFWNYISKPSIVYIGISYEERKRISKTKKLSRPKGIKYNYPLIDSKITRTDCIKIIKEHGLKIPIKSGCWICPFQTKSQLRWLYRNHKELFDKLVELENLRKNRHTLKEQPITYYVPYKTTSLDSFCSFKLGENNNE